MDKPIRRVENLASMTIREVCNVLQVPTSSLLARLEWFIVDVKGQPKRKFDTLWSRWVADERGMPLEVEEYLRRTENFQDTGPDRYDDAKSKFIASIASAAVEYRRAILSEWMREHNCTCLEED